MPMTTAVRKPASRTPSPKPSSAATWAPKWAGASSHPRRSAIAAWTCGSVDQRLVSRSMRRSAQCSVRARSKAAATPGRGFVATSAARVESENLLEPALVARFAAEGRAQECGRALERKLRPDHPRAERQDVHVVVLDALVGGV